MATHLLGCLADWLLLSLIAQLLGCLVGQWVVFIGGLIDGLTGCSAITSLIAWLLDWLKLIVCFSAQGTDRSVDLVDWWDA